MRAIALLRKKEGLSHEDFVHHYETSHVPLVRRLLPMITDYRRNYLQLDRALMAHGRQPAQGHPGFDVVTQIRFADTRGYEDFIAAIRDPEVAAQIAADEEHFLDRSANRLVLVEEHGGT